MEETLIDAIRRLDVDMVRDICIGCRRHVDWSFREEIEESGFVGVCASVEAVSGWMCGHPDNGVHIEICQWLIEAGCPVGLMNCYGETEEEIAWYWGNYELSQWLSTNRDDRNDGVECVENV